MFSKQSVKEKMCKNLDRKSLYMCSVSFDCKVIELPACNQKLVQADRINTFEAGICPSKVDRGRRG